MRELLEGTVTYRTLDLYEKSWNDYQSYCQDNKLEVWNPRSIMTWRTTLVEAQYSPNTINSALSAIKSVFKASVAAGDVSVELYTQVRAIASVSVRALRDRLRPGNTPLDDVMVQEIIDNLDASTVKGLRDRAILEVLASSGVRAEELCALRFYAFNSEARTLTVMGKTDYRPRIVPLSTTACKALIAWLYGRERGTEWLFPSFAGRSLKQVDKPITTQGAYNVVAESARALGYEVSPHDFRRYVATKLAEGNIVDAQEVLGHASIMTTQRYVKRRKLPSVEWR